MCPWCGGTGFLVTLARLGVPFRRVASLYEPVTGPRASEEGSLISALIDGDWNVFSERIRREDLAQDLTLSILRTDPDLEKRPDSQDYGGFFRRRENQLEIEWNKQAYSALVDGFPGAGEAGFEHARWTVEQALPTPLEAAFEDLATRVSAGEQVYRARIHRDRLSKARFRTHEMQAPPPDYAIAGRANQAGDPMLYVASSKSTALAEVRAWRGAVVALALIRIRRDLRVVDLKRERSIRAPFFEDLLWWYVQVFELLRRLGKDMSRPVLPGEENSLYRPTQLLAHHVRASGYDGVLYPSAMGPGNNFVFFDFQDVEIRRIDYIRVRQIVCFSETIDSHDENLYDNDFYDHLLGTSGRLESGER